MIRKCQLLGKESIHRKGRSEQPRQVRLSLTITIKKEGEKEILSLLAYTPLGSQSKINPFQ